MQTMDKSTSNFKNKGHKRKFKLLMILHDLPTGVIAINPTGGTAGTWGRWCKTIKKVMVPYYRRVRVKC